eukprot:scaffold4595_cov415-Prasinococcus_capsulatus_cf.AAC.10
MRHRQDRYVAAGDCVPSSSWTSSSSWTFWTFWTFWRLRHRRLRRHLPWMRSSLRQHALREEALGTAS